MASIVALPSPLAPSPGPGPTRSAAHHMLSSILRTLIIVHSAVPA